MEQKGTGLSVNAPHTLLIEDRRRMRITGVVDVERFFEDKMTVLTGAGSLTVWGENLKLGKLNPDDGQVLLEGDIVSIEYEQPEQARRSIFSRRK